ncbi:MAG: hypothetical protein L7S64_09270 [Longimicrobiales bacterium]|nr:hypothetical protein [Longimicrobiales bacterium]
MQRARLRFGLSAAVLGVILTAPGRVDAQVVDSVQVRDTTSSGLAPADTIQLVPDSLVQEVDSARLAILERLERLARPVGADSLLFVQDSVRLAAAAGGDRGGGGMDDIATELFTMPGYTLTEYQGESADFQAQERILILQAPDGGRARVASEGSTIEADTSITFDEPSGSIRTVGDATFTPPEGDPVDAVNMIYNLDEGRGTAVDATTAFNQQGANWTVRGDMPFAAQDSTFMSHAQFTSCEVDEPHYHFETDEIKIVAGNVLVARGVRLYFADVPVAWLPFMAQSLARGRSSGILTPRFSVNDIIRTSGGYRRRVSNLGFYWAASQYADALVSMDWFSETFFAMTGSVRYRFRRQFLEGTLNVKRFWNSDGSSELAIDTRHSWELDERTQLRISGRFVSDNQFVRDNSFNPQEVTQSIDSEAGMNRRFDWGSLSVSANRRQYLSDDRTEWLLPSANLSLSPITLFRSASSEAAFYNNMTWSGSGGFRRNAVDRLQSPGDSILSLSALDTEVVSGTVRSNLSLGNLTLSQSVDLTEDRTAGALDEAFLVIPDSTQQAQLLVGDLSESDLRWSTSVNYQQQLMGSTTLTPRLSFSGTMFRSNIDSLAQAFVSAPSRLSFGAQLKTDIYGFYGGVGPFEAIRHKITPAIDYDWSPESTPTELQRAVFGARALQPKNAVSLSLTQTWEAKPRTPEEGEQPTQQGAAGTGLATGESLGLDPLTGLPVATDPLAEQSVPTSNDPDAGPQRVQRTPAATLLAWRTSVIQYDFVQADSVGLFLSGFETTRLSNQFSSDYLRGLSVSMDHELFADELDTDGQLAERRFEPYLSSVNLGFSLGSSSSIFRWLTFWKRGEEAEAAPVEPEDIDELDFAGTTDESTIVPVASRNDVAGAGPVQRTRGSAGGWNANLSYSLQRPRDPTRLASQMLSGTVRLQPTEQWSVSWRTAYDLEVGAFNDHSIRLSRDLHRWEANFDFLQTATGNWTFRFEVSLRDNRDLKFDYKQRNLDLGLQSR